MAETNEEKLVKAIKDQILLSLLTATQERIGAEEILEDSKIPRTKAVLEAMEVAYNRVEKMLQASIHFKHNKRPLAHK